MVVQDEINIPGSSFNQKPNSTMSVMLEFSSLVARIVLFDTVGFDTNFPYFTATPVQRYSHIIVIIIALFKSYLNQ